MHYKNWKKIFEREVLLFHSNNFAMCLEILFQDVKRAQKQDSTLLWTKTGVLELDLNASDQHSKSIPKPSGFPANKTAVN